MLVAAHRYDFSGDIILAADGCRACGSPVTGIWTEELSREVKSVRLSEQCAVSLSSGTMRFINAFLAHIFDMPEWAKLPEDVSASSVIVEDESRYLRDEFSLLDLETKMLSFRLPIPKPEERRCTLVAIIAGDTGGGRPGFRHWRYSQMGFERGVEDAPVLYSLLDERNDEAIVSELTASRDTEKCIRNAIEYAAQKHPGLVNRNVSVRCLHEGFALRWL